MNVGMHCSINQLGLLQEVAEIGDPSVDPSSHICCLGSVSTSSRHDPLSWHLLPGLCWLPPAPDGVSPSHLHVCLT